MDILSHQRKAQGMLQAMGMTPIRWQSRSFRNVLEHAEKLASVELAALLGHEYIITGILPLRKPSTHHTSYILGTTSNGRENALRKS
jgi:hypothetical protein